MKQAMIWLWVLPIVTACGHTRPNAIKPNWIVDANGPTNAGFKSPALLSQVEDFRTAYAVSRCTTNQITTLDQSGSVASLELCAVSGVALPTKQEAAERFAQSGMRLSDSLCRAYFRRIGDQDQDMSYYRQTSNVAGGFVATVLGLTQSPAKSVALTAAGFSGLTAQLETFEDVYHFAPDVKSVEKMVSDAMKTYQAEVWTSTPPDNFYRALEVVETYQAICQTSNIRSLVNKAIERSDLVAETRTGRNAVTGVALTRDDAINLAEDLGLDNLAIDQVRLIAALYIENPSSAETKLIADQMSNQAVADLVTKLDPITNQVSPETGAPFSGFTKWYNELAETNPLRANRLARDAGQITAKAREEAKRAAIAGAAPPETLLPRDEANTTAKVVLMPEPQ